jgi:hypothetical protein
MSIYRCSVCDNYVDADKDGCNEDPNDEYANICDRCDVELYYILPPKKE